MTERDIFLDNQNVPRGTIEKFDQYAALLAEWQTRFNLVASSTMEAVWTRHFADSAQLVPTALGRRNIDETTIWLDVGSGAGFPGLVLALLLPGRFHLVEVTAKKCRFLEAVADELDLASKVTIHQARIETMPVVAADFITARACASLTQLFGWGMRHGRNADWLLLKGRTAADEVAAAASDFDFERELVPSITDHDARIVVARGVRRRR